MEQTETTQEPRNDFKVEHFGGTETVVGRKDAVRMAKRLSNENHGRVSVEREDGSVTMQFRGGSLETLVAETPDRRQRNRRQGR